MLTVETTLADALGRYHVALGRAATVVQVARWGKRLTDDDLGRLADLGNDVDEAWRALDSAIGREQVRRERERA